MNINFPEQRIHTPEGLMFKSHMMGRSLRESLSRVVIMAGASSFGGGIATSISGNGNLETAIKVTACIEAGFGASLLFMHSRSADGIFTRLGQSIVNSRLGNYDLIRQQPEDITHFSLHNENQGQRPFQAPLLQSPKSFR